MCVCERMLGSGLRCYCLVGSGHVWSGRVGVSFWVVGPRRQLMGYSGIAIKESRDNTHFVSIPYPPELPNQNQAAQTEAEHEQETTGKIQGEKGRMLGMGKVSKYLVFHD